MKSLLPSLVLATLLIPSLPAAPAGPPPKPQNVLTADQALAKLKAGNARYIAGTTARDDFASTRAALAKGQNPYAAILSCSDSRIGPEFAFDAGRGDLFVVRVAGNFLSEQGLASLEYTTAVLGTPLIVVIGHDSCGAVDAAIKVVKEGVKLPGHLPGLVKHIKPAVISAEHEPGDLLANSIRANVVRTVEEIRHASPVISALVAEDKVRVVGGIYHLATGKVEFLK